MENNSMPIKVVQFGEGNFLRGFVDWMVQKMNDSNIFNGSIAVVQPLDRGLVGMMAEQDYEYTHILKGLVKGEAKKDHYKNTTISKGVDPYKDFEDYLGLAKIDTVEVIVSNTTEAGIAYNEADTMEQNANVTFPAKLTRLLLARYEYCNGDMSKGFKILPCELIDKNADKLLETVKKYIELWNLGADFEKWVLEANVFCNTLVDRIVPGFPRDTIEQVWEELGYKDNFVVESEQFNLWVVQGGDDVQKAFPANEAGCNILFVDDVTPYKTRKVRILNGAHTTLVPVGLLYGIETVKESMDDAVISKFLKEAIDQEIVPTLSLPEDELKAYSAEVLERFDNPFVKHLLMSIQLNSMSKYRTRVLPSLEGYVSKFGRLPKRLVLALASYVVLYKKAYKDMNFDTKDNQDILDMYSELWSNFDGSDSAIRKIVETVLGYEDNWYKNLNEIDGLTDAVAANVKLILNEGIDQAIAIAMA